jgi:hypothetical protein
MLVKGEIPSRFEEMMPFSLEIFLRGSRHCSSWQSIVLLPCHLSPQHHSDDGGWEVCVLVSQADFLRKTRRKIRKDDIVRTVELQ